MDVHGDFRGWIKVWRKIEDDPIFKDSHLVHTFLYCLIRACHEGQDIGTSAGPLHLNPGEFITGRNVASKALGFKGKMWDRKIDSLRKRGIVTKEVTRHFTKISIVNWDLYQARPITDDQEDDPKMTNRGPTDDQPMTTYKNLKNYNNGNNWEKREKEEISHSADHVAFRDFYSRTFEEQRGFKYLIPSDDKDDVVIVNLVSQISLEELKDLTLEFFEEFEQGGDDFGQRSGFTVKAFESQVQRLRIARQRNEREE